MTQKPYLNLGCGRVILPAPKPAHYMLLPDGLAEYALWHNVDRNAQPGVDEVVDVFRYPFPWADNSFDGALCAHLVEHIPHEIRLNWYGTDGKAYELGSPMAEYVDKLANLQDGWFAFFTELHRVLTPGSIIHVLSPYAWSQGAMSDPSHTRYLTEMSFVHSMKPDPNAPFAYATGGLHLELAQSVAFNVTPMFQHLLGHAELLQQALHTQINVASELYAQLRVVK